MQKRQKREPRLVLGPAGFSLSASGGFGVLEDPSVRVQSKPSRSTPGIREQMQRQWQMLAVCGHTNNGTRGNGCEAGLDAVDGAANGHDTDAPGCNAVCNI